MTDPEPALCAKCGTDHDGYFPGTFGAELRCLRAQMVAIQGENGWMVDQVDALGTSFRRAQARSLGLPFTEEVDP